MNLYKEVGEGSKLVPDKGSASPSVWMWKNMFYPNMWKVYEIIKSGASITKNLMN